MIFRTPWLLAAGLCVGFGSPALADALDGDWCFNDGRNLNIDGPAIITPSGTNTTGDYARHTFRYVVPDGDPGAGGEIFMQQLNEQTMVLREPDGTEQTWKRCDFQTS